jgi:hypothetical protein
MELSTTGGTTSCVDTSWFPIVLWKPKVQYRIHKSSPPVAILNQTTSVHITPSHLSEIHLNVIHPPTSWSFTSNWRMLKIIRSKCKHAWENKKRQFFFAWNCKETLNWKSMLKRTTVLHKGLWSRKAAGYWIDLSGSVFFGQFWATVMNKTKETRRSTKM